MTPEYLKELLPSLLNADFAGATNVRLLSLARTYAALCDLATFDFPSGEYGTRKIWLQRIDTLFGVLRERCRRESDAALRCLRAGKHVLCEKPATISAAEMEEILHTARTEGRIFAEAVMNFYSPVTDRLRAELAQDPVVSARLDYSQRSSKLDKLRAGAHITSFDRKLYGGVLTDLGCYVLHFAVNLFGAPKKLDASAVFLGEVDGTDVLTLHYDGFDVSVTVSKCAHSMIGSEIQCDRATYTLKNLSVVLGVEKHTMDTCEEYECGIACPGWPIANPAMLPGVQERVVRRFDRWVRGEDLAAQQRLLQQSLTVQKLIEEAHRQMGY